MASAAEQLAANLNLATFSKATELKKRICFTLGALIVYRIGTYIPVPGVDASVMGEMLAQHGGGILVASAIAPCSGGGGGGCVWLAAPARVYAPCPPA